MIREGCCLLAEFAVAIAGSATCSSTTMMSVRTRDRAIDPTS